MIIKGDTFIPESRVLLLMLLFFGRDFAFMKFFVSLVLRSTFRATSKELAILRMA